MPEKTKKEGKPRIQVRDVIYGEPQPLEEGKYEINALVSLQTGGNSPVFGATGQFLVNAVRVGSPQAITDGKIADALPVSGKRAVISLEVKSDYFGDQIFPLRNIELPEKRKDDDGDIKITIVVTRENTSTLFATMARVNKKGIGVPGEITYVDDQPITVETDKHGRATIPLPIQDRKRRVVFFPTEFPRKKIRVYISERAGTAPAPPEAPCGLAKKLSDAFHKGWNSLDAETCQTGTERRTTNES